MFRLFNSILIIFCVITLSISSVYAEDIAIEATIDSNEVTLGSAVNLKITIRGTQNVAPLQLPKIAGFDVRYLGPARNISVVNGRYSSSITFTYSLLPLKTGTYTVPAMSITIDGQAFQTQGIPINVSDSGSASQGGATGSLGQTLTDKIFLELRVPREKVYLNERLEVKILMYATGVSVRDIQFPKIDGIGFSEEEYDRPKQYAQVIKGKQYDIIEFTKIIYPTRTGELTIGPAKTECNILVKSKNSRRNSLFDDDFFNSIFDRSEKRPITIGSDPVTINVELLPLDGKPDNFSEGVGNFTFDASISPTKVKVGDPITMKMRIQGEGNLNSVQFPKVVNEGQFKLYDPIIKDEGANIKTFEQVLIPKSVDVKEIKPLKFSYFNSKLNKYLTIDKGPFPISVSESDDQGPLTVVGFDQPIYVSEPEKLGEDIVFIKDHPGEFRKRNSHIYQSLKYYLGVIIAFGILLISFIYYKLTHKMETDVAFARKLKAPGAAKKGLIEAKKFLVISEKEKFYDTLFRTLQQYLGNKLHLSSGAVTMSAINSSLPAKGIKKDVLDEIRLTFEECDRIRYAPGDIDGKNMQVSLDRVSSIIDHLERNLK